MTDHKGLPVAGYQPQSDAKVQLVNEFKADEERLLRKLEWLMDTNQVFKPSEVAAPPGAVAHKYDARWIAVARTHFQEGFMALNRAVFQPQRIKLPEDE